MAKIGKNLDDLLDGNRAQILRYLVQNNGCSRVEIAKTIGLKQASITKIVRSLINAEVIQETGFTEGLKGRRSIGLSFNYTKYRIIGMKLSWQGLKTCLFDLQGNRYEKVINYTTEYLTAKNIAGVIEKMADNIRELQSKCPDVIAAGVALPGPFHRDTGTLLLHTELADRFYPIKEALCKKVPLPIFFEHDAAAGALAYWWFKTNCNTRQTLLHLLVSEGVGGGVVSNGQIFSGCHGLSTELGHIIIDYKGKKCVCGARGCLDAYCRSIALETRAGELLAKFPKSTLSNAEHITIRAIFEALQSGDELAVYLIHEAGQYLGYGLVSLIPIFDPDIVVISDIITHGGQTLMKGINHILDTKLSSYYNKPKIILMDPAEDLVLLGAAAIAIDGILARPTEHLIRTGPSCKSMSQS